MIDQSRGQIWHLTNEECYVLGHLVKNRDKVVSKQKLLRGLKDHISAELELVDIIHRLREFLGRHYAPLVETVADQGYLLHSKLRANKSSLVDSPFQSMSVLMYGIFTSIILMLMFWIYSEVDHPYYIDSYFEQTIYTQTNQAIDFELYPVNKKQKKTLFHKVNHFISELQKCHSSTWSSVSLAVSADNRLISLILMNNDKPKAEFSNIKVTTPKLNLAFMNKNWLVEMGICEK